MKKFIEESIKEKCAYLVTHNGCCHTDDIVSAALIELLLESYGVKTFTLVRTRNQINLASYFETENAIVFDVGDGEFDHHKQETKRREDGRELASIGLLWRYFKEEIIEQFEIDEFSWKNIDTNLIFYIDHTDNTGEKNPFNYTVNELRNVQGPDKDETFESLVESMKIVLSSIFKSKNIIMDKREKFQELPVLVLSGGLRLKFNSGEFIPLSVCNADIDGYLSKSEKGWILRAVNGRKLNSQYKDNNILFIHPTGFMVEIKYLDEELIKNLFI